MTTTGPVTGKLPPITPARGGSSSTMRIRNQQALRKLAKATHGGGMKPPSSSPPPPPITKFGKR